jgi:tRNA(Ile)-lysidine synthase
VSSSKSRALDSIVTGLPPASRYWVAYSGGVDSHALLHILARHRRALSAPVAAVHVNHQIQHQSGDWELHCRDVCTELEVPFSVLRVDGRRRRGESPEAAARTARYRGLSEWLADDAVLLTGQHRDDQAETLLLQLFRGAGPRGLAAMPVSAPFGRGRLVRPLLGFGRRDIEVYAHRQRLRWVEDPSNTDTRYDRNLLRQRILPALAERWPAISSVLSRAASLQSDYAELADALAAIDYSDCRTGDSRSLSVAAVRCLSPARQRNLLRHWIDAGGFAPPPQAVLEPVREQMLGGRCDANPLVQWSGAELRRYRDRLYLMAPLPVHDARRSLAWPDFEELHIASAGGVLSAIPVHGRGLRRPAQGERVEIRFRQGGEMLQPAGRGHRHALKKLFQEWGVPDWERARIPLIYIDGRLAAVAGLCIGEPFRPRPGEAGLALDWSRNAGWR